MGDANYLPISKTNPGNFFEDFRIGQVIRHATPRTVTAGDVALYTGLFGSRFAVQSSDAFAKAIGYPRAPSTICSCSTSCSARPCPTSRSTRSPISAMPTAASASPVYPGDTLSAESEVIGLKENSNRKTGIVYVRSTGTNQRRQAVLEYVRWVMVRKRDEAAPAPGGHVPQLPTVLDPNSGRGLPGARHFAYDFALAGSAHVSVIMRPASGSTTWTA